MKYSEKRESERLQYEQRRKNTSLQNMHFNRFLLIRYVSALFFFINMYGCLLLGFSRSIGILLPASLLIFQLASIWEQMKLFSTPKSQANLTKYFYFAQLCSSLFMLIIIFTPIYPIFFTFLNPSLQVKLVVSGFTIVLCLIAMRMIFKIQQIENRQDKQYQRILAYEKVIK